MVTDRGSYLAGRHSVVTGGGRGIGAAIAAELARLGSAVTLMGRSMEHLEAQAATLRSEFGVDVSAVPCDVTSADAIAAAFAQARRLRGDPYVLVNNAGQADSHRFQDTPRASWDRMLAVNLTAPYLCIQEVLRPMIAARAGRIINIASTAGLKGYTKTAAYCASKHGVMGLTRALAVEMARLGITVNAVCPGYTDTDMKDVAVHNLVGALGVTPDEALAMIVRINPRGSIITPREVANAVGWLCSPGATAITGQAIAVAAGEVM